MGFFLGPTAQVERFFIYFFRVPSAAREKIDFYSLSFCFYLSLD